MTVLEAKKELKGFQMARQYIIQAVLVEKEKQISLERIAKNGVDIGNEGSNKVA